MKEPSNNTRATRRSESLSQYIEYRKRALANQLSERLQRMSIGKRKALLVAAGLFIALLCVKLVVGSHTFSFEPGTIRAPMTQQSGLSDSLKTRIDSTRVATH